MAMGGSGNRAVPYINVTPLIDVLLVLLIIFMVVTPLKPSRFRAEVPTQRDPNEDLSKLAEPADPGGLDFDGPANQT